MSRTLASLSTLSAIRRPVHNGEATRPERDKGLRNLSSPRHRLFGRKKQQ
ncbi:hypothetical protein NPIL_191981, partial [Nephila pilipes]